MPHEARRRGSVALSFFGLLIASAVACHTVRPVTLAAVRAGDVPQDRHLKLTYPEGRVVLEPPWELDYPWVVGEADEIHGRVPREPVDGEAAKFRFDLEDATKIELETLEKRKSWALGLGIGAAGAAVVYAILITLLGGAVLAAGSCPAVYAAEVPSPQALIGELYPGATGASQEREDWLALSAEDAAARIRIVIENHHAEIQHLAAASLVRVHHAAGVTAVATPGGPPLVLAAPRPPVRATARGVDVLDRVGLADGRFWQANQAAMLAGERDVVEARFEPPRGGDHALVVRFENTLYSGARLALHFDEACGNPASLDRAWLRRRNCGAWRRRNGFDAVLRLHDRRGERTLPLGAAGNAGSRLAALPIGPSSGPIEVTVEAGAGFLRIDQLALARIVDPAPSTVRFQASSAAIRAIDGGARSASPGGAPATLEETGERLELEFRPPPQRSHGSWFFVASGYYELQPGAREEIAELRAELSRGSVTR